MYRSVKQSIQDGCACFTSTDIIYVVILFNLRHLKWSEYSQPVISDTSYKHLFYSYQKYNYVTSVKCTQATFKCLFVLWIILVRNVKFYICQEISQRQHFRSLNSICKILTCLLIFAIYIAQLTHNLRSEIASS